MAWGSFALLAFSIGLGMARAVSVHSRFADKVGVVLFGFGFVLALSFPILLYLLLVRSRFPTWLGGVSLLGMGGWIAVASAASGGWAIIYSLDSVLRGLGLVFLLFLAGAIGILIDRSVHREQA